MSTTPDSVPNRRDTASRSLPAGVMIVAGLLLAIPIIALAIVPIYSKDGPRLWGFPFFYWYQFLWVFLASAFTWSAYLVIRRSRRERGPR